MTSGPRKCRPPFLRPMSPFPFVPIPRVAPSWLGSSMTESRPWTVPRCRPAPSVGRGIDGRGRHQRRQGTEIATKGASPVAPLSRFPAPAFLVFVVNYGFPSFRRNYLLVLPSACRMRRLRAVTAFALRMSYAAGCFLLPDCACGPLRLTLMVWLSHWRYSAGSPQMSLV